MCEPKHSIVQFQNPDDSDSDQPGGGGSPESFLTRLGKVGAFIKKVGRFLHVSRLGKGHTGALGGMSGMREYFIVPPHTDYEVMWWDRTIKIDGAFTFSEHFKMHHGVIGMLNNGGHGRSQGQVNAWIEEIRQMAEKAARTYADAVSIGSLHALRSFLEVSLDKTESLYHYAVAFQHILNAKGRCRYELQLRRINKKGLQMIDFSDEGRESLKRLCLGMTRQRNLLVPEWADDKSLWVPHQRKGLVLSSSS